MHTPDEDRLTAPQPIGRLLRRLVAARCLLSIRCDDDATDAPSALLAVGEASPELVLDAFADPDRHRRVAPGSRLRVTTRIDGVAVRFECTVAQIGNAADGPCYLAALRDGIEYRERRSHFRVEVPAGHRPRATLRIEGAGFRTELVNLSLDGFGLEAQGTLAGAVEPGDPIESCSIALPDGPSLKCALVVRHVTPMPERRVHILGVRFVDLMPGPRQQLQEYLFALQREALQQARQEA